MTEGIKIQTTLPMVEPTRLRTFSMSGVLIPTTKVIRRIPTVIPWDLKEMQKCNYKQGWEVIHKTRVRLGLKQET